MWRRGGLKCEMRYYCEQPAAQTTNCHLIFSLYQYFLPPYCGAVGLLELQYHRQQGGVDVPDTGEDEGDDGEAGNAPDHTHLHVQQPGSQI